MPSGLHADAAATLNNTATPTFASIPLSSYAAPFTPPHCPVTQPARERTEPTFQIPRPGPQAAAEPLRIAATFAEVEPMVGAGTDSSRIVVLQGQDEVAARAAAERGSQNGDGPTPVRAHTPPWRTLVVMPTYNEKDNLEPIVRAIHHYLDTDILVVDDGSPDGTGAIADRLAAADQRIHVLHRQGKQGIGSAYTTGFRFAIERGYPRICEMDADFSHAPWDLPRLVFASGDAELVLGSRYVKGGCTVGWGFRRRMLSKGANLYTRVVLGSGIADNTAGFRCFHTAALARLDLTRINAQGYAFQIEMAYRMVRSGFRVKEIPIHFVDRRVGKSKMDGKIAREALLLVPRLRGLVPKQRIVD